MLPRLQDELLELTKALVRIPSTHSRPGEIHHCAVFIGQWLTAQGIHHQYCEHQNVPSLVVLPKPGYAPVLLLSHFDVVEADDDALFEPYVDADRLYGRGAVDDKYAVALSLILFREHLRRLRDRGMTQADMPFGLLMTGDEEVGGFHGVGTVSKDLETDFFIVLDGGAPNLIVTKEKGILHLVLRAHGKAAHASRPWLGQNAFDLLVDDYRRLQQLFRQETDDHWHRTLVLSNCHSGSGSRNIVPDSAEATLDIRFTEEDDPDQLLNAILKTVSCEVEVKAKVPVFVAHGSPLLDLLSSHAPGAKTGFEHGASDARYLGPRNIPGVVWGPDSEMSQHTRTEHVVVSSLFQLYDALDGFLGDVPGHLPQS